MKSLRILLVEDSQSDADLLIADLTQAGYDITFERVETADAMTAALERGTWDLVLSDFSLPTFSAPAALAVLQQRGEDLPFIIVSGTIGEETAVTALKAGAHDFLGKGRLARLGPAIERELRDAAERKQRRQLEEQLRQAQKMEAIGELAGSVAHDFNNMLTAILGYTELMLEEVEPDQRMGQDLREVRAAAVRAAALTRQLLAFSRKRVLVMTPVDLTDVVRGVEPMLVRLLGAPITIQLELADHLHLVMGDAAQLEHLLVNLSVNARDAMPEGGTLRIATRNIDLGPGAPAPAHAKAGPYVTLTVTDTGTGMPPEVLARIFEPFFTTKEPGRGTGLGLAAVYGTATQFGGHVEVASTPGSGSTFVIYLPKTDRPREVPAAPVAHKSAIGSETILVVEDEEGVRRFVKTTLERSGYQVLEAEHAEGALQILAGRQAPIHLLVTDVILPGLPGPALAAQLTQRQPDLRVLFMSGYTEEHGDSSIDGFDAAAWIEKPFSTETLLTKVRRRLDQKPGE
jgi:two-component system cell cycle sensor histidine kinase/response regulator CckA